MSIYQLNQDVSFDLPLGWKISTDTDMDGVEHPTIFYDRYIDSSGKVAYKWSDFILTQDLEISSNNYLNDYVPKISRARYIVPGTPKCAFLVLNQSRRAILSGSTIFSVGLLVQVDDHSLLCFSFMNLNSLNGMHRRSVAYVNMCRVAQTVRIRGKALPLKGITPEFLQQELEADLNLDDDEFVRDAPDLYLYPHYHSRITPTPLAQNFSSMVVTNAGGCDYQFIPLKTLRDEADDDEQADLLEQILEQDDTADTSLSGKVRRMQPLFHVNRSAFDPSRDRESEIAEGYLESAYQFSALRSFAWTVAKYCKDEVLMPEEVDLETLHRLLKFISNHDWLNYSNDNFCQGLCGGSDLHVYYLPDCIDSDLQDQLLPSNEDREFAENMRTLFPNYNEIPNEVHSLDSLREDLEYIYPAVYRLWDELKQDRNPDQPLTGDAADIVYAWCVVANAASVPFFSEDGPSVCRFSYPNTRGISSADTAADSFTFGESRRSSTKPPISSKQKSVSRSTKTQSVKPEINFGNAVVIPEGDYRSNKPGVLSHYHGDDAEVVIPEGITEIGDVAFSDCKQLSKVIIPESVIKIGDYAFSDCEQLKNIVVPRSITEIGDGAFYNCKQLTSIVLPEGVTKIGDRAFSGCEQLVSVVIPASVTEIGESAFSDCKKLTSIALPEGVTKIEDSTFSGCKQLENVAIPKLVTEIGESAFSDCKQLTSIVLPEGVTKIRDFAFVDCEQLADAVIPKSLIELGVAAFWNCSDDLTLHIPEGSAAIAYAEEHHLQYDHILSPENWQQQAELSDAISLPDEIQDVLIPETDYDSERPGVLSKYHGQDFAVIVPEGIVEIGKEAFSGCKQLVRVVLPESLTMIGENAFSGCEQLEDIVIPEGVAKIGKCVFSDCKQLTSIVIPEGVTQIENYTFSDCKKLEKVVIPKSVLKIKRGAFSGCEQLTDVEIPDRVTEIGSSAFYGCEQLTSIVIPTSVIEIGDSAFYGCEQLTSIVIPDGITEIGNSAFSECKRLKNIVLPASLTEIEKMAFCDCERLTSIVIPDGITEIGNSAFSGCESLVSIVIPESVIVINENSFFGCDNLKDVYLLSSKVHIANSAFRFCDKNLTLHILERSNAIAYAKKHCFELKYDHVIPFDLRQNSRPAKKFGSVLPSAIPTSDPVVIPKEDYSSEEPGVFKSYSGDDTNVILPEGITKVGDFAFSECTQLTQVMIPEGVTEIGNFAFSKCKKLTNIGIPNSVTRIGKNAFSDCRQLKDIVIPKSVTVIEKFAFSGCRSLSSITIPDSVTKIESDAFSGCRSLSSVTIQDSVTKIEDSAFANCWGLTNVVIPDSVTKIDVNTFYSCKQLTSIVIPESVVKIGDCAFFECEKLKDIYLLACDIQIGDEVFLDCEDGLTLHVPEGSNAIAYAEKENLQYDFKIKFVPTTTAPPVQQAAPQPEKMEPPASAQPDVFGTVIPESDFLSLHPNTLDRYTGTEKELIIPEGIQVIGENAFLLKPIILMVVSEGVRTLSDSAFYSCSCLTEITLPDTLKVIGKRTFQNCIKLTQIVIPESVTTIGENAFAGCSALQDVYLPGKKIQIGSNAFPKNVTIHAPEVSDGTIYARQNSILVEHDLTP